MIRKRQSWSVRTCPWWLSVQVLICDSAIVFSIVVRSHNECKSDEGVHRRQRHRGETERGAGYLNHRDDNLPQSTAGKLKPSSPARLRDAPMRRSWTELGGISFHSVKPDDLTNEVASVPFQRHGRAANLAPDRGIMTMTVGGSPTF
jgi:hypothetical protein